MYQPITIYIGLRYINHNTKNKFKAFVSYFPIIGIIIGVTFLITMLSIMNGFKQELKNSILKFIPQAIISSDQGYLKPHLTKINFNKLKGVHHISPITTSDVILQSAQTVTVGVMLGIDPNQQDSLTPYILNTRQNNLQSGQYNIILGIQLAKKLHVKRGDQLRVIVPSVRQHTAIGPLFSQRLFNVIGIFFANSEVDDYQLLMNIQDASRLMHYPSGYITGLRLWFNEPLNINQFNHQFLKKNETWQDWRTRRGELFQAIQMEKLFMGLLFSLIIIVSSFNIITSLGLRVLEKQKEIAILRTQGMHSYQIIFIFMIQGISLGIIGSVLGTILGISLSNYLHEILPIICLLMKNSVSSAVTDPLEITSIILITIIISILATIYPALKASMINPVEILRYE